MRPLALHQITAIEANPLELVSIAKAVGCDQVCVFVRAPLVPVEGTDQLAPLFPTIDETMIAPMQARLAETGIGIMNAEYFPIEADTDVESYRAPLATAGALGAKRAVTHVHDTDFAQAAGNLARLCDLAAGYGLDVGLEFMGLSPGCTSLARARQLVESAGRPNLGIAIDALHFVRTGATVAEVAALPPGMIAYVQLCDGAHLSIGNDYRHEALNRLAPGEGVFPLHDLLRALPPDVPIDVEVPSVELQRQGMPATDRARRAVVAARAILERAGRG